jgi:micrococcal nuclease
MLLVVMASLAVVAACGDDPKPTPQPIRNPDIEATMEAVVAASTKKLTPEPDAQVQDYESVNAVLSNTPSPTPVPQVRLQWGSTGPPAGREVVVARVVDGDTIDVQFPNGAFERIRLLGVDTPETDGGNRPREFGNVVDVSCLNEWGGLSSEFTREALENRVVLLTYDERASGRDRFGRFLAYVDIAGVDFNAELVARGYARVFTRSGSGREQGYLSLQTEAKEARVGLWECQPEPRVVVTRPPGIEATIQSKLADRIADRGRAIGTAIDVAVEYFALTEVLSPTPEPLDPAVGLRQEVVIECIAYDGVVPQTESDEYVQVTNLGTEPVDLAGWHLTAEDGRADFLFQNYLLMPGRFVRVYTNERHPETGGFSFGSIQPLWGNDHPNAVKLLDESGAVISTKSYPPGCMSE